MPYAILRFQKAQAGGVAGRDRHNERKKEEYKSNPNIDKARSERNYHLVEPNGMYARCCKDRINAVGARTRSNSVIMVEALITTSPEVMEKLNSEQQRQFFERAAAFLYERIGMDNVVSAVVHMDEKTPHMHFCFVPITKDGRLSAKEVLGNKAAFSKWQDDFYDRMHGFYPELERGLPAAITGRKHIPPYLFRSAENVSKSYDAISKAISDVNIFNAGKKREEAIRAIGKYLPDCYKLIEQSKSIDRYVSELEQKIQEQERSVENANAYASAQRSRVRELNDQIREYEQDLKKLQAQRDKAQKIIDAIPADVRAEIDKSMKKKGAKRYEYER